MARETVESCVWLFEILLLRTAMLALAMVPSLIVCLCTVTRFGRATTLIWCSEVIMAKRFLSDILFSSSHLFLIVVRVSIHLDIGIVE